MTMEVEWTSSSVIQLVEEYRKRGELWDRSHELYRVQAAKYDAWTSLANMFGCEIIDLKKKFNSIFASRRREKSKIRQGGKSRWFLYNHLEFLSGMEQNEDVVDSKSSVENALENYVKYKLVGGKPKLKEGVVPHKCVCQKQTVEKPTSHDVEEIYIMDSIPRVQDIVNEPLNDVTRDENLDITEEDILETNHKKNQVSRTQEDEPMSEAEEEDTEQEHEVTIKQEPVQVFATQLAEPSPIRNCKRLTRTVRRRIREQPRPHRAPDTDSKLLELLRLLRNSDISRKKDECDIFGEYIASSLRKHDERTQSMIKQAINNILFEQEMKKYSSSGSYAEDNTNPLAHTAHILIPDN